MSESNAAATSGVAYTISTQYVKDFSFENPGAPQSLAPQQTQPQINIQINVTPKQLSNTDFEVELKTEGKASIGANVRIGRGCRIGASASRKRFVNTSSLKSSIATRS